MMRSIVTLLLTIIWVGILSIFGFIIIPAKGEVIFGGAAILLLTFRSALWDVLLLSGFGSKRVVLSPEKENLFLNVCYRRGWKKIDLFVSDKESIDIVAISWLGKNKLVINSSLIEDIGLNELESVFEDAIDYFAKGTSSKNTQFSFLVSLYGILFLPLKLIGKSVYTWLLFNFVITPFRLIFRAFFFSKQHSKISQRSGNIITLDSPFSSFLVWMNSIYTDIEEGLFESLVDDEKKIKAVN